MTADVSTIEDAYDEIVKWQKHIFLVPIGKIGKEFISALCPSIATYAINTYRMHVRLFVMGRKELLSAEGTS